MAVYCRQWRNRTGKRNRFNDILREYIELKHNTIYEEAHQFFQSLQEKHPDSKNLVKTKTFKEWKNRIVNHVEESSDESQGEETDDRDVEEPSDESESQEEQVNNRDEALTSESCDQSQREETDGPDETTGPTTTTDILSPLVEGLIPSNVSESISQVDNIIHDIIEDLEQDQAVRDFLNQDDFEFEHVYPEYQHDEGIGLNIEMELEGIIEPFDYALEVEGGDF